MAILNFGKEWKEKVQTVAETAANAAKTVAEDIKLPDAGAIKDGAQNAFLGIKDSFKKKDLPALQNPAETEEPAVLSTLCALKIIYYMMSADGTVLPCEEEKFEAIGKELDPAFAEHCRAVAEECRAGLESGTIDPDDYFDVLRDCVDKAIQDSAPTADSFVTAKLLIWDLLTVAFSDKGYDEAERKLLKLIVRKLGVDKALFLEMESSIYTLMDIEREIDWIKTTDRPYLTIESIVNELADRKNVIFESVKDLISL